MKKCVLLIMLYIVLSVLLQASNWENVGLGNYSISSIVFDHLNPGIIYAGSDNYSGSNSGIYKSFDGGNTWNNLIQDVDIRKIVLHQNNTQIIYASSGVGILKSIDGGNNWFKADSGIDMSSFRSPIPLVIDPKHPDTLYTGTTGPNGGYPYKSIDGGKLWTRIDPDSNWYCKEIRGTKIWGDPLEAGVTAIAIDPENTDYIYIGTSASGDLCKSDDAGEQWLHTGLTGGLIYDIKIAIESSIINVATSHSDDYPVGIFQSFDYGHSWINPSNGMNVISDITSIAVDDDQIFVIANADVYYKDIHGTSWQQIGESGYGFKTLQINDHKLYAAGENGIYFLSLDSLTAVDNMVLPDDMILINNYPNPFNSNTLITYELNGSSDITLEIINAKGEHIRTLFNSIQSTGEYTITWDGLDKMGKSVSSGIYFCVIYAQNSSSNCRMLLLK